MENYSKQREEIIGVIKEMSNYPTAEEIYFVAKQKDPELSRSTVYRNLGVLVKNKVITQIAVSNGPDRYEYIKDIQKHGYAVCSKCGKIDCFDYNFDIDIIKKSILKQTEIEVFDEGFVIKGICNSCKKVQN